MITKEERKILEKINDSFLEYGILISPEIIEKPFKSFKKTGPEFVTYAMFEDEMIREIETGKENFSKLLLDDLVTKFQLEKKWYSAPESFVQGFNLYYHKEYRDFQFSSEEGVSDFVKKTNFELEDLLFFDELITNQYGQQYKVEKVFEPEKAKQRIRTFIFRKYTELEMELNEKVEKEELTERVKGLLKDLYYVFSDNSLK